MKQIACFPVYENIEFLSIWMHQAETMGYEVFAGQGMRAYISQENNSKCIFLNWFEEVSSENRASALLEYLKKRYVVKRLQKKDVKLLFVIHNRQPHENRHPYLSLLLRKHLCRVSNKIVVLSDKTNQMLREQLGSNLYGQIEQKITKLPLPNYINVYPSSTQYSREKLDIPENIPVFLSVGHVRPYKNIELILKVASEMERRRAPGIFVIAGNPISEEYWQKLEKQAQGLSNVRLNKGYVPDSGISSLVDICDVMIVPMNTESSINSSECLLAFSYKKPVIAPRIGTVLEYPEKYNYCYDYLNQEDHFEQLLDATLRVVRDHKEGLLSKNGEAMYQAVLVNNGPEAITQALEVVLADSK